MFDSSYKHKNSSGENVPASKGINLADNRVQKFPVQRQAVVQEKGKVNVNDDARLEHEADVMGSKAMQFSGAVGRAETKHMNVNGTVQRKPIKIQAGGLTTGMQQRFTEAYDRFSSTVLAGSPLAQGANNHVVIHGVSQKSHGIKDYGATTIYIGNNGYQGEDYTQFTELWDHKPLEMLHEFPQDVAVRIVITVNMTIHAGIDQLYATLLHEWHAHAEKWAGVVEHIRAGKGRHAVAWVKAQGAAKREQGEHQQYANKTDEELKTMAKGLGLQEHQTENVAGKMKMDRDRYDKHTGEQLK